MNTGAVTVQSGTLSVNGSGGASADTGSYAVAPTATLSFGGTGLTSTNSSAIAVSPAAADRLVFATQPGSGTYGSMLGAQPEQRRQRSR